MAKVDLRITDKLAWLLTKPKRIKIAVGGRGSQKSTGIGDIMLMFADNGERICCAREFQNSIDDSVHESLKDEIERLGIEGFNVLNTEIRTAAGGEIFYKGLARNITSLKSLAGVKRLWIEEGESVSDNSLKVLTPSIRSSALANNDDESEPPEIWITMNRGASSSAIAQKYLKRAEAELARTGKYEDDLMMVVEVNWRDNPWFPPELEQERQDDYKNLDRAEYDHIWEGAYNDYIENAIIKAEWFDAAIDAHIKLGFKPQGAKIVAHDPSDSSDPRGLVCRHGAVVLEALEKAEGDVNDGADWATDYAINHGADLFVWDCDGMGISLKRQMTDALHGKDIAIKMFRGSESPDDPHGIYQPDAKITTIKPKTNKETFKNKRAQYYWRLRDRFFNTYRAVIKREYVDPDTMISISSEIKALGKLRTEVCRIPKKYNGSGYIQIMSKQEMLSKHQIESPNLSDSLMMSLEVPDAIKAKPVKKRTHNRQSSWMAA